MDSITQITLGAAVGEAIAGKKLGNKAIIWGAIGGTIPDLDVLFFPFISELQQLSFHRGFSHAFFYILLFVPIFAYLVHLLYKKKQIAQYKDWFWLFMGSIITHPILDAFTTFGTQLWLPFSRERVALSTIFVADPLYTVPFLLCVIIASRFARTSQKRRFINYLGLGLSTTYLLFTFFNKQYINRQVRSGMEAANIPYQNERFISNPTPLNNVLWYSVAEVPAQKGYYLGLYSWFDQAPHDDFIFVKQNAHLANRFQDQAAFEELKWFSDGYYNLEEISEDTILFNDIRFGIIDGWNTGQPNYPVRFKLFEENGKLDLVSMRGPEQLSDGKKIIQQLTDRIRGRKWTSNNELN